MNLMSMRRRRASNKGFNLIEAAIVLGIVGLVVGGIWVAATSVYANLRSKSATDQLLKITQSVRALYATSATTGYAALTDITAFMAQANVLPSDTLTTTAGGTTSTNTTNPWSGQLGVVALANGTQFAVVYSNVPPAACVDFVMRNAAGTGRDTGMRSLGGDASAVPNTVPAGATQILTIGQALTLNQAQTVCASTAANVRNIGFTFDLKG
jgi:type II secretory pathway pseudopilin PulG